MYQTFPKWVYHPTAPSRIVQSQDELEALGDEWVAHPSELSAPAAAPPVEPDLPVSPVEPDLPVLDVLLLATEPPTSEPDPPAEEDDDDGRESVFEKKPRRTRK